MEESFKGSIDLSIPVGAFNVDEYLVHDDFPTPMSLGEVDDNNQMMITFLKLPSWLSVFSIDKEFGDKLMDKFLESRLIPKSHRHAIYFCDHHVDTEKSFKLYSDSVKKGITEDCGFTPFKGDSNVL